jgi:type I restriction enzyme S subunit
MAEIPITVPPLDEQNIIGERLDAETTNIDSLVAEIQTSITLLREKRSSLISAAVTGEMEVP